jgi:hypothetical protein
VTDRIEYLYNYFARKPINKNTLWWNNLNDENPGKIDPAWNADYGGWTGIF